MVVFAWHDFPGNAFGVLDSFQYHPVYIRDNRSIGAGILGKNHFLLESMLGRRRRISGHECDHVMQMHRTIILVCTGYWKKILFNLFAAYAGCWDNRQYIKQVLRFDWACNDSQTSRGIDDHLFFHPSGGSSR